MRYVRSWAFRVHIPALWIVLGLLWALQMELCTYRHRIPLSTVDSVVPLPICLCVISHLQHQGACAYAKACRRVRGLLHQH